MDHHVASRHCLLRRLGGVYVGVRETVKGLPMNVLIIMIAVLCFGYLLYALVRPERF